MNRRQFLTWVGIGGLASYFPVAIAACSSNSSESTDTTPVELSKKQKNPKLDDIPRPDGFLAVGTITQLDEKGQILKRQADVIVIRNPETKELVALKSLCTHQGCTVKWDQQKQNLFCPCHNSLFDIKGEIVSGPATKPLSNYEVKEDNGLVLIRVS